MHLGHCGRPLADRGRRVAVRGEWRAGTGRPVPAAFRGTDAVLNGMTAATAASAGAAAERAALQRGGGVRCEDTAAWWSAMVLDGQMVQAVSTSPGFFCSLVQVLNCLTCFTRFMKPKSHNCILFGTLFYEQLKKRKFRTDHFLKRSKWKLRLKKLI